MSLKDLLAFTSFKEKLRAHFSLEFIKIGFINALLLSAFIAFSFFEPVLKEHFVYLATFGCACFLLGFALMIFYKPCARSWFYSGFFLGIFWFYWMAYSLVYFNAPWLIALEILGIGVIYGIIFALCYFIFIKIFILFTKLIPKNMPFCKFKAIFLALGLICTQFIHPFGFNWLNYSLIFIDTPLQSIFIGSPSTASLPFKVHLNPPQFSQAHKWDAAKRHEIITAHLKNIDEAIAQNARLVILPETAFAFVLSSNSNLHNLLLEKSQQIAILAGAVGFDKNATYNSAFFYDKGAFKRVDKHILVPFGEQVPLPAFMRDFINKIFFDSASDFASAPKPGDIEIDGITIRVAICYEGTRAEFYATRPQFLAMISNNAWFYPSSEPALQKLLLKYYARKNQAVIYHSANGSKSEIIR